MNMNHKHINYQENANDFKLYILFNFSFWSILDYSAIVLLSAQLEKKGKKNNHYGQYIPRTPSDWQR